MTNAEGDQLVNRGILSTVNDLVFYMEYVVLEGAIDTPNVAASIRMLPDKPETRTALDLEQAHAGHRDPAVVADIINALRAVLEGGDQAMPPDGAMSEQSDMSQTVVELNAYRNYQGRGMTAA